MTDGKRNSRMIYKQGEVKAVWLRPFGPYNPKNIDYYFFHPMAVSRTL